jgi:alkyl hydroperoxide reductase subunit D
MTLAVEGTDMTELTLDDLRERMPDPTRDLKLNLQAVLGESSLSTAQKYGVALASAIASRSQLLQDALRAETRTQAGPEVEEDALAAAALMGMNNVYYRFRHMVGKDSYGDLPARLRMNRLARPAGSKVDFELFALAVSAINGCESCVQAHEKTVRSGGLTEAHVNDAIRIAATIHGVAIALNSGRN